MNYREKSRHKQAHTAKQIGGLIRAVFAGFLCTSAVLFGWLWIHSHEKNAMMSVLFVGSPMRFMYAGPGSDRYTMIELPSDKPIEALHGYGKYTPSSLWKLGFIEKRPGLLRDSISDLIALPISAYFGRKDSAAGDFPDDPCQSPSFLGRLIGENYISDSTLKDRILFILQCLGKSRDARIVLTDTVQIDSLIGQAFENSLFRNEKLSVSISNTTDKPGLAEKASRYLTRVGIHVISLSNDERRLDSCEIEGSPVTLASSTARYISDIFHCRPKSTGADNRSDLSVFIGTDFADLYTR